MKVGGSRTENATAMLTFVTMPVGGDAYAGNGPQVRRIIAQLVTKRGIVNGA
jgi:hypothetical protein